MVRALVLIGLCGCNLALGLREVGTPPVDASLVDSPIPGLVAYYPMDDLGPMRTCMADARGGPSGTCNNGMPMLVSTIHGSGYQFDGSVYITVPGMPAAIPTPPFTVTVWISPVQPLTTDSECAVSRVYGPANANSWQFCIASGLVEFFSGDAAIYAGTTSVAQGTWHQLGLTFDGTSVVGFVDAQAVGTMPANVFIDSEPTVIGLDLDGGGPSAPFHQIVDELAIYDRVLTAGELALLYQR